MVLASRPPSPAHPPVADSDASWRPRRPPSRRCLVGWPEVRARAGGEPGGKVWRCRRAGARSGWAADRWATRRSTGDAGGSSAGVSWAFSAESSRSTVTRSAKCSVAKSASSWVVRAMSRVVPMRMLASFTIDSRHRSRRSRSSSYATTPCSEVRSTYPVAVAIRLRVASLIRAASSVRRAISSSRRSRRMPWASRKARSTALTGIPCRATRRTRSTSLAGTSMPPGSTPCRRADSTATTCSATLSETLASGRSHSSGISRRRHCSTSAISSSALGTSSRATRDTRPSAVESTVTTVRRTTAYTPPLAGRRQPIAAPYTWSTVRVMRTRRSETITERYSSQSGCSPAAAR